MEVTYDLRTADGREAEAMRQIIELRRKELGETTAQCCKALAINILKSVRADTRVATEKGNITATCVDGQYTPGWKPDGKFSKRVLRSGKDGAVVDPKRVVWKTKNYVKGEVYHTYAIVDKIGNDKTLEYLMVADSQTNAVKYAKEFHKKKVRVGKYLAKFALGLAMHEIHERENTAVGQITERAKAVGMNVVNVWVADSGFDSGNVNIHVEDQLDYASKALKSGDGYVQTAIQKALNSMAGYLNHRLESKNIEERLEIPFEELTK